MLRLLTLSALLLQTSALAQPADYSAWRDACAKLPSNRSLNGKPPENALLPIATFAEFDTSLEAFLQAVQAPLERPASWVGSAPDPKTFLDTTRSWFATGEGAVPFQPFAHKLALPADSSIIFMGDLHGDVRSLMATLDELNARKLLDGFTLRDPKTKLLFLGDFTDRGQYGVEVLATLFRLKAANPDAVHFARGNHEDFNIVARYGFLDELRRKFGQAADITKFMRAFDRMPVVIYVGTSTDFIQANHGGMEPGYDPRDLLASPTASAFQLLGTLKRKTFHAAHPGWLGQDASVLALIDKHFADFTPQSPTKPHAIGFLWNDFTVFRDEPLLAYQRSLVFGQDPTRTVLTASSTVDIKVRAVIRAHQHSAELNPLMSRLVANDGAFSHWPESETTADKARSVADLRRVHPPSETRPITDGSVWTFNVSPDSTYGVACKCDFATIGILNLAPEFKDWTMRVVKVEVFNEAAAKP